MPSKGTPITALRIDGGLMEDIELTVELRNAHARGEPWTLSDFIRIACREKIAKMIRSRRYRPRPGRVRKAPGLPSGEPGKEKGPGASE